MQFDAELVRKLNQAGPRYTSYPTADRFSADFGAPAYAQAVARAGAASRAAALSIYVHIPFCASLCHYCACNKIITRDQHKAVEYLAYLDREIALQAALRGAGRRVDQLHFGGGTPTFLTDAQMDGLLASLRRKFDFAPETEGEFSIEVDPRTVSPARVAVLRRQGYNRISLGIQDFDPAVQRAVNRSQPHAQTVEIIAAARRAGFRSVSVDLIYGLPLQSVASFGPTLEKVVAARPDRIAVYNYAHLPRLFKSQNMIAAASLPDADTKLAMLGLCIARLTAAGYVYIGMDHFALPDDDLAASQRAGTLQRNFQGYSTHADADMVAFGVSAISAVSATYSQNEKTLAAYYARLDAGVLPIARGIVLDADDMLRRRVIGRLMCDFALDFASLAVPGGASPAAYFASALRSLAPLAGQGLLEIDARGLRVTPRGRLVIRNICMPFDRHLQAPPAEGPAAPRYSNTI